MPSSGLGGEMFAHVEKVYLAAGKIKSLVGEHAGGLRIVGKEDAGLSFEG